MAMAENHSLRALEHQMRTAATDLRFSIGTGPDGSMVNLGRWTWPIERPLPELPPLPRDVTPRQRRDHHYAEGLRTSAPPELFAALITCREILADVVEIDKKLRADGYSGNALSRIVVERGQSLLRKFQGVIGKAENVQDRIDEVRRDLAREHFDTADANRYMQSLGLRDDDETETDRPRETAVAVQTAVYDVAIVQALKALTPPERTLVLEERELPKVLSDPRVLSAVFRAPRALMPFDDEELRGIAALAFRSNWPKTAAVTAAVSAMLEALRPPAGDALLSVGRMIDPAQPFEVFRRVPGGRWALEPLITVHGGAGAQVFRELSIYSAKD